MRRERPIVWSVAASCCRPSWDRPPHCTLTNTTPRFIFSDDHFLQCTWVNFSRKKRERDNDNIYRFFFSDKIFFARYNRPSHRTLINVRSRSCIFKWPFPTVRCDFFARTRERDNNHETHLRRFFFLVIFLHRRRRFRLFFFFFFPPNADDVDGTDPFGLFWLVQEQPTYVRDLGRPVLADPLVNKGTAFLWSERERFHLRGMLPARMVSMEEQVHGHNHPPGGDESDFRC